MSFQYPGGEAPALREIELEIRSGETLALVGPSGAGKSTLVDLVARFIDPSAGRITVDGVDLRELKLADWNALHAMVGQVPFLFHSTIGENIAYGKPGATVPEIESAARAAHIHDFIATLPQGYATSVADMGSRLSGGQRQRITIARALLKGAPLLLLDEATSALDPQTTEQILDLLAHLVDKSLVVAVAKNGEARYRLLETVRQYATERLAESGELAEARERHENFFLALAERGEPELRRPQQGVWLERLEAEYGNLLAALEWSVTSEEVQPGLRLAGALGRFWLIRGFFGEGRRWLEELLKRSGGASAALRAMALSAAGDLAAKQGDYAAAHSLLEEGLAMQRALGDKPGIAASLNRLGVVAAERGEYEQAAALLRESLALFRECGVKDMIAGLLNNLGNVVSRQGDDAAARSLYEESLAMKRELGDKQSIALSLSNLGHWQGNRVTTQGRARCLRRA
jgi:ABC-type multidrug transport system ATPase subunit/predicted negative regulator of RcsB-dependent stress response